MFGYDVFNAVSFINIPGAPTTDTFKEVLTGYPTADSSFGNNRGYTGPSGYVWSQVDVEENNGNENHLKNPTDSAVADLFEWSNGSDSGDWLLLYPNDAFHIKGSDATTSDYEIRFVTNSKNTSKAYDYVVNMKKGGSSSGQSLPAACNSSTVTCFSNYVRDDAAGYVAFRVKLSSSSDYLSFDVGKTNSSAGARDNKDAIHAARIKTQCGTWERHDNNEFQDKGGSRIQIRLLSVTKNEVQGCIDPLAKNTDDDATVDDGSCQYTTTSISSFTVTPATIKIGEPVTVSWNLASPKFSNVSVLYNGSEIVPSDKANAINPVPFSFTPTSVGPATFDLTVTWDKPNSQTRRDDAQVTVQSATSFVECTDSNRAKDSNGECADCKTGYFLDNTTGLCSQCSDPNRSKNTDGSCGDCIDRYELTAAGICEPVISGGNDCTDSNRETNSDGSCASSCKSGYSFDSSNYCQSDSGSTKASPMGITGILVGVGLLTAVALIA